jgi:hypothetical protein
MRIAAYVLLSLGALTTGALGSEWTDCYRNCDGYRSPPAHYRYIPAKPHYVGPHTDCISRYGVSHHWHHHGCGYRGHRHGHRPVIIYGDAQSQMGPVYLSTGQYHYGSYVSHRANFGYGGCRAAFLPYGPKWHVASNC